MFDVQNVSLSYGARQILDGATFKVEDGERAAIIGPNGTGKSTLLKIVAGLLKPESGAISIPRTHEIGYLPQDMELDSSRSVLEECKTVFEEVMEHEREMRVLEDRMAHVDHESEEFQEIGDRYEYLMHETERRDLYSMDATVGRVLTGLGFKVTDLDRPCNEFSGGWQMRICLAKILLQNPDVLLLDEPTNHLDIETIVWLADWIKQHEGSVLMVSHERFFMDALCQKVIEIERSKVIVYRGNYSEAQVKRAERREMQRRTYENQQNEIQHIQKFVDRFRYQASKAALVQSRVKQLERIERVEAPTEDEGTIHFRFPPSPRSAKDVLIVEGIHKAFGAKKVLKDISLSIYRGEKIALVGVNGAGKTTLMRILAGRDPEYTGKVTFGSNVDMGYFAQYDREDLHPNNTVLGEFLSTAPLSVSDKARGVLGAFLFSGDDVEKKISMLSGGERTRLRLAKMLCGKTNLLLMDEPTNHLDIGSRLTLERALQQYEGAVLLVSHDRYFLDNVATRVVEISEGEAIVYPGTYSEYLERKERLNGAGWDAAPPPPKPAPTESVTPKETNDERRERQQREKEAKNRLRKVEKGIEENEELMSKLEELIRQIENEMAKPEVATNPGRLSELTTKLQKAHSKREEAEAAWLELTAEKEELETIAG